MRGGCRLNITTCGNYPRACVMPERYFVFTCCSADVSISASIRKRKNFDSCVSASFAVVLASLAIENQAFEFSPRPSSFLEKYRLQVVHLKAITGQELKRVKHYGAIADDFSDFFSRISSKDPSHFV